MSIKFSIFLKLLFCFLIAFSISARGQTKEELEKRRRQIQQEIASLQKAQSDISKDTKASLSELKLLDRKLRSRYAVIDNLNSEIRLIDNTIFINNREIYRLQKQLDTLRQQYARTIEYAYKNRSSYDMLNFIFTATSFNDAVKRATYLKSYRKYRHEQVDNINRTQKEMSDRIALLTQNKQEKSKVIEEQNQQKELLESEKNEKNRFVTRLKAREKEIEKEVAAKRKVERSLQNSIAAIIKREIEAAKRKAEEDARNTTGANVSATVTKPSNTNNTSVSTSVRKKNILENTPEVTKVSVGFENNRGNLPWPLDKAIITSSFGRQRIEGTKIEEDNGGITLQTESGAPVKAVFEGIVTTVYDVAGSQTVTIKHGKYFTTYFNMSSVNVSKGTQVTMGQVIGKAGENFDGDGEIVFMVNEELKFINPELWLKRK